MYELLIFNMGHMITEKHNIRSNITIGVTNGFLAFHLFTYFPPDTTLFT